MRKILTGVLSLFFIFFLCGCSPNNKQEYLRIHIRANSNDIVDQSVKYEIKSELVKFLTPYLCEVGSKSEAIETINNLKNLLESKCDCILKNQGLNYTSNIRINNEYFPTRNYDNITLSAGYYDAVIVELGEAVGDNWWCVMYPPLCLLETNSENYDDIEYKFYIKEIISQLTS